MGNARQAEVHSARGRGCCDGALFRNGPSSGQQGIQHICGNSEVEGSFQNLFKPRWRYLSDPRDPDLFMMLIQHRPYTLQ